MTSTAASERLPKQGSSRSADDATDQWLPSVSLTTATTVLPAPDRPGWDTDDAFEGPRERGLRSVAESVCKLGHGHALALEQIERDLHAHGSW